ncbi:MAG: FkbM family methyltransferase [Rhodothermaceae bacterium]|nr:FkbM family methyltransferase [Rhodothermaceae bacterium]MXW31876.1 FkbM family methyltransferase [Rhodothermaceae bacterium]MYC04964.1 FkbM family methyltransferase [Rhodothermaceae bacterium]MYE63124.1 FkbM family methyltransferase [Rhodothermaceae bacterium]MYI18022.1 FkbM family methyltransferase [Rhodothermaceae bacterium]
MRIPKHYIKRFARRFGFDVIRFNARSSPVARRIKLFQHFEIGCVLDVGASTGGYGVELRSTGYDQRIISFEPSSDAFRVLEARASRDALWDTVQLALGKESGEATLNLSNNLESNSILRIKDRHTAAYPQAKYVGQEVIAVDTLDHVFDRYCTTDTPIFLKIDAQGYEHQVLLGADASLARIRGVQVELSLEPMDENETPFLEVITHLQAHGFNLMSLQPVIDDPVTGQLLQVDGLFFRPLTA